MCISFLRKKAPIDEKSFTSNNVTLLFVSHA